MKLPVLLCLQLVYALNQGSCGYYKAPITTIYGSQKSIKCIIDKLGMCSCKIQDGNGWKECLGDSLPLSVILNLLNYRLMEHVR